MKELCYLEAEFTKRVGLYENHFSEFEQLVRCVTRAIDKIHLRIMHKYNVVDIYMLGIFLRLGLEHFLPGTFSPGIFPPGEKM